MIARYPPNYRRVFIDTSANYALASPQDINASAARAISDRLKAERWRLFTTNFILAETHALLLARRDRGVALRVLQEITNSSTVIVRVRAADERRAQEILVQYDDKDFTLTDATSFAVMERLGISYAFAFDRDFAQYGLNVLSI